jgi:hypothetical protein
MPGLWYRAMPNPGTTRVVNTIAEFDTAYALSVNGDKIQMNAGSYSFGTPPNETRIINKTGLQIVGNGHVTITGSFQCAAPSLWFKGLEITNPAGTNGGVVTSNDSISVINCLIHDFLDTGIGNPSGQCILNPYGNNNQLLYGNVFYNSRHVCYLQNQDLDPINWFAHNYCGDVYTPTGANSYLTHFYSASGADHANNWSIHENIFANGTCLSGADGNAEIVHNMEWVNNRFYRSGIRQYNKPCEHIFKNNNLYESLFELGSSSARILEWIRVHGQGEFSFTYRHPTEYTNNLIYNAQALNVYSMDLRSDRYGAGGHDPGVALLRTQDLVDNNSYYGTLRMNCFANNITANDMTTLAAFRTATLNAGKQWDTNSTFTAGVPPNHYVIYQNDYDPDRAMIAVFRYTGANVPVTLPRAGDIYEIHNEWGSAAYSGGTSYNVTQQPFFGIIKYTGGAMAQFLRPNADTNNPGTYTNQAASSTNIYQAIDEAVADDADYIQSPVAPTSTKVYVTKLQSGTDPVSSSGHVLRWRYNKDAAGGAQINMTVELRQAYVSEASLGTLIATRTFNNVSDVFTNDNYTLTGGEADAITDYTNLYLRISTTQV